MFKRAKNNSNKSIPVIDINDAVSISDRLSKIRKGPIVITEEDEKMFQQGAQLIELLVTIQQLTAKNS